MRLSMHLLSHVQLVGAVSISPIVRSNIRAMTPVRGKGWQNCIQTIGLGAHVDSSNFCRAQASQLLGCGWSRIEVLGVSFPFKGQFKRVDWIWITSPGCGFF